MCQRCFLKIICYLIFLCNNFLFANQSEMSMMWQKLIHNQNNENQIVSKEYYLSSNINATPKEELDATIKLLNSEYGYETACNFPARYEFIKSNFNNVPSFDLSTCSELNKYLKSFPKDKLSIVFTSEYTNNPSSLGTLCYFFQMKMNLLKLVMLYILLQKLQLMIISLNIHIKV